MSKTHTHDWADQRTAATFLAAISKLGVQMPEGDDTSTLMRRRNVLRQATNSLKTRADAELARNDTAAVEQTLDEAEAVGAMIRRTQNLIDARTVGNTDTATGPDVFRLNGQTVRALRTADAIRDYYRARASDIGIASPTDGMSFSDIARAAHGMNAPADVRNALSVGTDASGGYAIPTLALPHIMPALAAASSLMSAGAGLLPITDGGKSFNLVAVNALPSAAWRNENAAISESDPSFRAVVITPRSLSCLFKVSRELLMDGGNIDSALVQALTMAVAKELDRVGLRGSGSAPEPRGILNTSGIQSVTNGTNGALLSAIKFQNHLDSIKAILAADGFMPTASIMAPRTLTGFGGLADSTGQPLRAPDLVGGMKFLATSQVPINLTVGSSADCSEIYTADFSHLLFAIRETVSIGVVRELYAASGQVGFVVHFRGDVAVTYPAAFAVATGVRG